jgi:hypothetical protein
MKSFLSLKRELDSYFAKSEAFNSIKNSEQHKMIMQKLINSGAPFAHDFIFIKKFDQNLNPNFDLDLTNLTGTYNNGTSGNAIYMSNTPLIQFPFTLAFDFNGNGTWGFAPSASFSANDLATIKSESLFHQDGTQSSIGGSNIPFTGFNSNPVQLLIDAEFNMYVFDESVPGGDWVLVGDLGPPGTELHFYFTVDPMDTVSITKLISPMSINYKFFNALIQTPMLNPIDLIENPLAKHRLYISSALDTEFRFSFSPSTNMAWGLLNTSAPTDTTVTYVKSVASWYQSGSESILNGNILTSGIPTFGPQIQVLISGGSLYYYNGSQYQSFGVVPSGQRWFALIPNGGITTWTPATLVSSLNLGQFNPLISNSLSNAPDAQNNPLGKPRLYISSALDTEFRFSFSPSTNIAWGLLNTSAPTDTTVTYVKSVASWYQSGSESILNGNILTSGIPTFGSQTQVVISASSLHYMDTVYTLVGSVSLGQRWFVLVNQSSSTVWSPFSSVYPSLFIPISYKSNQTLTNVASINNPSGAAKVYYMNFGARDVNRFTWTFLDSDCEWGFYNNIPSNTSQLIMRSGSIFYMKSDAFSQSGDGSNVTNWNNLVDKQFVIFDGALYYFDTTTNIHLAVTTATPPSLSSNNLYFRIPQGASVTFTYLEPLTATGTLQSFSLSATNLVLSNPPSKDNFYDSGTKLFFAVATSVFKFSITRTIDLEWGINAEEAPISRFLQNTFNSTSQLLGLPITTSLFLTTNLQIQLQINSQHVLSYYDGASGSTVGTMYNGLNVTNFYLVFNVPFNTSVTYNSFPVVLLPNLFGNTNFGINQSLSNDDPLYQPTQRVYYDDIFTNLNRIRVKFSLNPSSATWGFTNNAGINTTLTTLKNNSPIYVDSVGVYFNGILQSTIPSTSIMQYYYFNGDFYLINNVGQIVKFATSISVPYNFYVSIPQLSQIAFTTLTPDIIYPNIQTIVETASNLLTNTWSGDLTISNWDQLPIQYNTLTITLPFTINFTVPSGVLFGITSSTSYLPNPQNALLYYDGASWYKQGTSQGSFPGYSALTRVNMSLDSGGIFKFSWGNTILPYTTVTTVTTLTNLKFFLMVPAPTTGSFVPTIIPPNYTTLIVPSQRLRYISSNNIPSEYLMPNVDFNTVSTNLDFNIQFLSSSDTFFNFHPSFNSVQKSSFRMSASSNVIFHHTLSNSSTVSTPNVNTFATAQANSGTVLSGPIINRYVTIRKIGNIIRLGFTSTINTIFGELTLPTGGPIFFSLSSSSSAAAFLLNDELYQNVNTSMAISSSTINQGIRLQSSFNLGLIPNFIFYFRFNTNNTFSFPLEFSTSIGGPKASFNYNISTRVVTYTLGGVATSSQTIGSIATVTQTNILVMYRVDDTIRFSHLGDFVASPLNNEYYLNYYSMTFPSITNLYFSILNSGTSNISFVAFASPT